MTSRSATVKRRRAAMTPKQRVLKKYPHAYAYRWAGTSPWVIYSGGYVNMSLNECDKTAAQAWADSARRLK